MASLTPADRDPNLILDDYYFFSFQDVLESKAQTSALFDKIRKKFSLPDYTSYAWYKRSVRKINKTKTDILVVLTSNNTKIQLRGGDMSIKDLLRDSELTSSHDTHDIDDSYVFNAYLESQLGYLTPVQVRKLEDLHRSLNDELHELYGTMEYHKITGG